VRRKNQLDLTYGTLVFDGIGEFDYKTGYEFASRAERRPYSLTNCDFRS
jgi:hypothetical protein